MSSHHRSCAFGQGIEDGFAHDLTDPFPNAPRPFEHRLLECPVRGEGDDSLTHIYIYTHLDAFDTSVNGYVMTCAWALVSLCKYAVGECLYPCERKHPRRI